MMVLASLIVLIAGLAAGVVSMVGGIDRLGRGGARVKYFNLPTFAAAATVFGIVGYPVARYTQLNALAVLAIAGAAAVGAAAGVVGLIAGWAVPSAEKEVKDERYELQGQFARVTRAIDARNGGEIEYEIDGVATRVPARSVESEAIDAGTEVVIERIESATAYVERWSKIAQQLELPA